MSKLRDVSMLSEAELEALDKKIKTASEAAEKAEADEISATLKVYDTACKAALKTLKESLKDTPLGDKLTGGMSMYKLFTLLAGMSTYNSKENSVRKLRNLKRKVEKGSSNRKRKAE